MTHTASWLPRRPRLAGALGLTLIVGLLGAAACQAPFNQPVADAPLDEPYFRCHVQPILTRSCAMFACHAADGSNGTNSRFFRLYARNRLRLPGIPESMRNSFLTAQERAANFTAAVAMVDPADPMSSYLLLKPLDQQSGGYYHRGAEIFMQGNVFLTPQDPDYQVLRSWIGGAKEIPTCIEPGSNM